MAALKTQENEAHVLASIAALALPEPRHKDALALLEIMETASALPAKMWGNSIIGFGKYHYRSARSKQEGDWFILGFSPRKTALALYLYCGSEAQKALLPRLGKFSMGKSCIYVKKLSDIQLEVLIELIHLRLAFEKEKTTDLI